MNIVVKARRGLLQRGDRETIDSLIGCFKNPDQRIREAAVCMFSVSHQQIACTLHRNCNSKIDCCQAAQLACALSFWLSIEFLCFVDIECHGSFSWKLSQMSAAEAIGQRFSNLLNYLAMMLNGFGGLLSLHW